MNKPIVSDQMDDLGFFNRELGIRITRFEEGLCEIEMIAEEKHLNRSGTLHGGVVASLLDVVGGYAGTWCNTPGNIRRAVTLSMSNSYLQPGGPGLIRATGKISGGGYKIFFTEMSVFDADGTKLAFGMASYKITKGSEKLEGFKP